MQYCSLSIRLCFHHPQMCVVSALTQPRHSFWSYFSALLQQHTGHLLTWGVHLSVSYLFAFSYCSWGSQGKNAEVVCRSLSSGPYFVRTLHHDPPVLGGPTCTAHSFIKLDKVVIHGSVWLVFCDCGFHSVWPLINEDKRLAEASWWEGLAVGKTGSCSGGQGHAQQIFNPVFC